MEPITAFVLDRAKRQLRASTILEELLTPHAYIPMDISLEKIKEAIKELGLEGEIPEPPEDLKNICACAMLPLDSSDMTQGLHSLGRLLAMADVSKVVVVCEMSVKEDGKDMDVLCVANIDLKAPDTQILLPYAKEPEDVAFGEASVIGAVEESLRDAVVEGFLLAESQKFIQKSPEGDTDAYVDNLPTEFPNVDGALNTEV